MTINEQTQIDTAGKVLAFAFPHQAVARGHLRAPAARSEATNVLPMVQPADEAVGRSIAAGLGELAKNLVK